MELHAKKPERSFELLPTELHLRIRNELLRDPTTNLNDFKSLRLVCRAFDYIWSPIVLANVTLLFPDDPTADKGIEHLRQLVDGKHSSFALGTLTMKNWHLLNTWNYDISNTLKDLWTEDRRWAVIKMPLLLMYLPCFFLIHYLREPKEMPHDLKMLSKSNRARCYAKWLPRKLQLPNTCSAKLIANVNESRWVIYRRAKILEILPALTELELCLPWGADMVNISKSLNPLRNLRKLTLRIIATIKYIPTNRVLPGVEKFSTLIARNPNLTHLAFRSINNVLFDLSLLLRDVPVDRPLTLEHVTIDGHCRNLDALIPHIQSLSSMEIYSIHIEKHSFYTTLHKAAVFPSTIVTNSGEPDLFMYLDHHPAIVKLSLGQGGDYTNLWRDDYLPRILRRQSGTLQHLGVSTYMLQTREAEMALLACKHLDELVLTKPFGWLHPPLSRCRCRLCISNDNNMWIIHVIAQLNRSLTVVIRAPSISTFRDCVNYCKSSNDPLIHDLVGRIVYEPDSQR